MHPKKDPVRTYLFVFAGLIFLTILTVTTAYVDLGLFNIVVTILIAGIKTTLILLFFMHVLHSTDLVKVFVGVGFLWLVFLVGILMSDYITRTWDTPPQTHSWITEDASHYLVPKDHVVKK